jgi:adenylate cyclase
LSSADWTCKKYTAVFVDIRGFTKLFQLHDTQQVAMIVGDWFTLAEEKIRKLGGFIDKFLGDGMLAFFAQADQAFYACCSLLGVAKQIDGHLNKTSPLGWLGQKFTVGIGMEFGHVLEGSIPASEREHVLRFGDCINMASRLAEIADPWEILIGNNAYEGLKGTIVNDIFQKIKRERRKKPGEYEAWSVVAEAVI